MFEKRSLVLTKTRKRFLRRKPLCGGFEIGTQNCYEVKVLGSYHRQNIKQVLCKFSSHMF